MPLKRVAELIEEAAKIGVMTVVACGGDLLLHPHLEEVLDLLGAAHLADRDYDELSSGEARRILIARALVHSPCLARAARPRWPDPAPPPVPWPPPAPGGAPP